MRRGAATPSDQVRATRTAAERRPRDGELPGATEDELTGASGPTRVVALGAQGRLFPHQGTLELELHPGVMNLTGWRRLTPDGVPNVSLTFTTAYTRWQAAGTRGNYPSFGAFANLGKPLVLELADEAPLYLLPGYRWWSGVNQNHRWYPILASWLADRETQEAGRGPISHVRAAAKQASTGPRPGGKTIAR